MSDFPEGADWWKAKDGRWYAPPATSGEEPPPAAEPIGSGPRVWRGRLILLAVGLFVLWGLLFSSGGSDDDGPPKPIEPTMAGAKDVCEQAVKNKLNAPSTADVEIESQSVSLESVYTLTGVVDAENVFGAMIRSSWTCVATHVAGSQWRTIAEVTAR